ncbi:MAG: TrmJ/YjtD family RNA methyltransferase [Treponema sp.]|jgi:tRNA/rRNA methyltransferase/tRNA (cytidine32/uridine32-2'-O)-methyltransferase|nr:TrmJ/YjtD family RNA methyltransferase [Treponema sp.]
MRLADIVIVLCRPEEAGNVGAVCRAMKNAGLASLRLVSPASLDDSVVRARAIHAADVWEAAQVSDTLAEAIADCSLVIGTTRRRGSRRKSVTLPPEELALFLRERAGKSALVFGNERTGLEDAELALCNFASHIPAHDAFPSLNLSHAVQIYAYALFRALGDCTAVLGEWVPLKRARLEQLVQRISDSLALLGFYTRPGREEQERFLQDIFARASLTEREAAYMGDLFSKAAQLALKAALKDDAIEPASHV